MICYQNNNKLKNSEEFYLIKIELNHGKMKINWKINTKAARENIWKIVRKYLEIWKGISKFNPVIMMSLICSLLLFSLLPTSLKSTGFSVFCYFWEYFLGAHSFWMLLFLLWVFSDLLIQMLQNLVKICMLLERNYIIVYQ